MDTDGLRGATVLDLNFDKVPAEQAGAFDLVTDFGTSEHVFDQTNAFRITHDLTASGGMMLHVLPFQGTAWIDHCFYAYQPDFFVSLARANGYKLDGIWILPHPEHSTGIPWNGAMWEGMLFPETNWAAIMVLMTKQKNAPFAIPYQTKYEPTITPEAAAAHYPYLGTAPKLSLARTSALGERPAVPLKRFGRVFGAEIAKRLRRLVKGKP